MSDAEEKVLTAGFSVKIRSMARPESQIMYIARIGSGAQTEWGTDRARELL